MFTIIAETQSVSEAAWKLNISQPTASYALKKLHQAFNAPLRVRSGGKMHLIETGKALATDTPPTLESFSHLARHSSFDPLTSDRNFTIMGVTSDLTGPYGGLTAKFRERTPHAAFSHVTYDRNNCSERLHEDVDIFVGANLPDSPSIERIVQKSYPVVTYFDTSVRSAPDTIERLLEAEFVSYTDRHSMLGNLDKSLRSMGYAQLRSGSQHANNIVDAWLIENGHSPREFRYTVSDTAVLSDVVRGTDMLVSASTLVHEDLQSDMAAVPFPGDIAKLPYEMRWNKRRNSDPALLWLLDLVHEFADN